MKSVILKRGAIGVFDSGFGGLDILREIVKKSPEYNYIYLGDTARTPYGTRSKEVVYNFTRQAVDFLFKKNCQLIILACNTTSSEALRRIQQKYLPRHYPKRRVLGVIIPAAEAAIDKTYNGRIGVIATEGTVNSGAFERELKKLNPKMNCPALKGRGIPFGASSFSGFHPRPKGQGMPAAKIKVFQKACPLLVPIVEAGEENSPATEMILKRYLRPLTKKNIDTLILGCTHYGLLQNKIRKAIGKKIKTISESKIVAEKLKDYLKRHPEIDRKLAKNSKIKFLTTDLTDKFKILGSKFFGRKILPKKVQIG